MTDRTATLLRLSAQFDEIVAATLLGYRGAKWKTNWVSYTVKCTWHPLTPGEFSALIAALETRFETVDLLMHPY